MSRKGMSIGDAIVLIALLVFICAWVGGWLILPDWNSAGKDEDDGSIILLIFIAGPPLWAGWLAHQIVVGRS